MKTRFFFIGVIALMCVILLPSCSSVITPEECKAEIDDSFRAEVAAAVFYLVVDDEQIGDFGERLDALAAQKDAETVEVDVAKYELALKEMAETEDLAAHFLDLYNEVEPNFSKWEKQDDKDGYSVWTATELNSNIVATFTNNKDFDWDLTLDEESFTAFVGTIADAIFNE